MTTASTPTLAATPAFTRRRSGPAVLIAATLVMAIGLAACAGSSDQSAEVEREQVGVAGRASDASAGRGAASATGESANAAKDAPALEPTRLRAVSGSLVVRTAADADLEASVRQATTTIVGLGGYLFSEDSSFGSNGSATVTYKVPPDRYDEAVTSLSELGTAVASSVDTTDVTDAVVDLDSRIRSAEASVARVRNLLEEASNLGDVTMLEGELTRRETTLEQLTGQRRQTVGTAEMSTLALTLDRKAKPEVVDEPESWMASVPGFGSALESGWRAFSNVMRVLLAVVGYVAPFAGLVIVALGVRRVVRRRTPVLATVAGGRDGEI